MDDMVGLLRSVSGSLCSLFASGSPEYDWHSALTLDELRFALNQPAEAAAYFGADAAAAKGSGRRCGPGERPRHLPVHRGHRPVYLRLGRAYSARVKEGALVMNFPNVFPALQ